MVSQLTVGVNSLVTLAEADSYLADSVRATGWISTSPDKKAQSLITAFRLFEKQSWQGTATGSSTVTAVAISSGGTGYAVNDVLTIAGGTFGQAARVSVSSVSSGVITGLALIDGGTYDSTDLATPNSATGGTGSSASITLTYSDQSILHPRIGLVDCDAQPIGSLDLAQSLKDAQIELAYDLSQDAGVETQKNTGSNIKKVGAGSAQVEFFRASNQAGESSRFPTVVQELIKCFIGSGTTTTSGSSASGVDHCSQFDTNDRYDLYDGEGFP